MELKCTITTPEQLVLETAARLVVVPARDGELGIMPHHAPLMAILGTGELRIEGGGAKESVFIDGGFVQVVNNTVNVLATDAARASAIDIEEAKSELARLESESASGLSVDERAERNARLHAAKMRVRIGSGA